MHSRSGPELGDAPPAKRRRDEGADGEHGDDDREGDKEEVQDAALWGALSLRSWRLLHVQAVRAEFEHSVFANVADEVVGALSLIHI